MFVLSNFTTLLTSKLYCWLHCQTASVTTFAVYVCNNIFMRANKLTLISMMVSISCLRFWYKTWYIKFILLWSVTLPRYLRMFTRVHAGDKWYESLLAVQNYWLLGLQLSLSLFMIFTVLSWYKNSGSVVALTYSKDSLFQPQNIL